MFEPLNLIKSHDEGEDRISRSRTPALRNAFCLEYRVVIKLQKASSLLLKRLESNDIVAVVRVVFAAFLTSLSPSVAPL